MLTTNDTDFVETHLKDIKSLPELNRKLNEWGVEDTPTSMLKAKAFGFIKEHLQLDLSSGEGMMKESRKEHFIATGYKEL